MNTWIDPQFESRARIFTVTDVNVKLKVRDRQENLGLHRLQALNHGYIIIRCIKIYCNIAKALMKTSI